MSRSRSIGAAGVLVAVALAAPAAAATAATTPERLAPVATADAGALLTTSAALPVAKPAQTIQATANPLTAAWFVPQLPEKGDILQLELSVALPHKLKDLFADVYDARVKEVGKGDQPSKIVTRWRVTEVGQDGKVKIELHQVELTWPGGLFTRTKVDTVTWGADAPTFVIGLDVRK